jgi:hypothetical protein
MLSSPPPPCFAWRASPVSRGRTSDTVLATRHARALPTTTRRNRLAPGNQRGSGAPRGASNQCRATPTHVAMSRRLGRGARRRQVYAVCATHLLPGRARLPALCCGSRQGFDPLTQLQAMLSGTRVEAGVTRPLLSQSRDSTSRRGPRAAGHDAQSRPGAECIVPRAGTAPAPSFESALAKGALSGQGEGS